MGSTAVPGICGSTITRRLNPPKSLSGTRGGDAAVCTEGVSASKQHDSSYPILDYTNVIPTQNWTSYSVKEAWFNEHFISGPHYMAFTHKMGQYGAYKCQYTCNSADRCNSFFVWFVNVNTPDEHMNCVLFNAVVPQAEFAPSNGTIAGGAYDRLCERPSSKSP
ncbi:hypothetical protein QBC42DRAFT_307750 [Cladorrhinum samala]|uniref:Apple domain-containing protein n=1 Tax=Cladorrhinum samala TaxID=585594 RepID=A0AAV9HG08_9PEZI|nr:hypothetical protein QBC42DRAFT_307750 [Cladorrhinum samala]